MVRKVRLTKKADKRFDEILEYLNKEFGKSTVTKFIERTYSFFDLIVQHPHIGRIEDKKRGFTPSSWKSRLRFFIDSPIKKL